MKILKSIALVGLGFALGWALQAPARPAPQTYDEVLKRYASFNGTLLLARGDKVLYQAARGYTDHKRTQALNVSSAFNLASLSKSFTALAVAQLAQAGKLNYSDKITQHLDLPYPEITVEQLLHHNSGIPDYMSLANKHWDTDKLLTNDDVLALFRQHKPKLHFAPGSRHEYSNSGYQVLASLVEAVSGQSFAAYVKTHILAPAGMNDSYVYEPGRSHPTVKGIRSIGRFWLADDLTWMDGVVGDGGVYSSVPDLLRYQQALYGGKLVTPATLERMLSSGRLNSGKATGYGFGWVLDQGGKVVWHNGSWVGFRSLLIHDRRDATTAIVLSNNGFGRAENLVMDLLKPAASN